MTLREIDKAIATLHKEHDLCPDRKMAEGHLKAAKMFVERMEKDRREE